MKSVAEDSLLGATIWLRQSKGDEQIAQTQNDGAVPGDLKSEWGIAIGEIHLSKLAPGAQHHRWTEIGIDILPNFQGKGYGREAIEWALDYAFRRAGLHRVKIRAFEWNTGAVKLYEKLGFKHEGRERETLWHEGRWWDGVMMGMLEGEWWAAQRQREAGKHNQETEERRTSRAIKIVSGKD
jgi:RimJ/RimL family protein N-acetyltransferase